MVVLGLGLCKRRSVALYVTPALAAIGLVLLTIFSRLTTCFEILHPFGKMFPSVRRVIWFETASRKPGLFNSQRLRYSTCTNAKHHTPVGVEWPLGVGDTDEIQAPISLKSFPFIIRPATYEELNVVAYILTCSVYGVKPPPIDKGCGSFFTSLKVGNNKQGVWFTRFYTLLLCFVPLWRALW